MESAGSEQPATNPEFIQQPPKAFTPEQFMPHVASVQPYLATLGYKAIDATSWEVTPGSADSPQLAIKVTGHHEQDRHTWYHVDCTLTKPPGAPAPQEIKWRAPRRLKHMREELHWGLKKELEIPQKFGRFAGMPGTTAALNAWCETLAGLINKGQAHPKITAAVLGFLDVPADGKPREVKDVDSMMNEISDMVKRPISRVSQAGPGLNKAEAPVLGVIMRDMKYSTSHGSTRCPASFDYDVIYKVVQNFTLEMSRAGVLTPGVEQNFDDTIKLLESQGCWAITGDCGFMMAFQKRARAVASVPVFMSAMVQCPAIACAFEPEEKILMMTASSADLHQQKTELLERCGVDVESERFIIVGCEDTPLVKTVYEGLPPVQDEVQPMIVKKAMDSIKENPAIRAIFLECTELPPYADALRAVTGLPVWDCITAADFYISAFKDNPRFGLNDWQQKWQKVKEQQPSSTKSPQEEQLKKVTDNLSKRQHPILGVIRMDFNFDGAAAGDVQNPASYGYDVIYKCVPGLTFELAQKGTMPPQVEQDFKNSIKWLEGRGATCITGDCGFLMAYQKLARKATTLPVFMSSMVQCPMVSAVFDLEEKILILTANSHSLSPQKEVLLSHCGFNVSDDHFVIEGCQDIPGFEAVLQGMVVDAQLIEEGIVANVRSAISANPKIRAIVCECHGLAQWADALRKTTGLPVFDIITCADFFVSAMVDNPRFGMNEWQLPWDETIKEYKFGQHLTQEEKERVVTL